jgi:SAM-dependent methyltransferase
LAPRRLDAIRNALEALGRDHACESPIVYFAPWDNGAIIKENSVDMIYSQAVLEHVDDLEYTYQTLYRWLKPGGVMSHEIDFKCHGQAAQWNGHWAHSDFSWRLIKGTRTNLLNRQPHSMHVDLLKRHGFHIVYDQRSTKPSGITRSELSRRFKHLSDEDLVTSSSFIQGVKVAVPASVDRPTHSSSST